MAKRKKTKKPSIKKGLRQLTFGDFDPECSSFILPEDEAALIVMDQSKMLLAMRDPSVNAIVCAVAGPEEAVAAEKRKYENDIKYIINFYPASPADERTTQSS